MVYNGLVITARSIRDQLYFYDPLYKVKEGRIEKFRRNVVFRHGSRKLKVVTGSPKVGRDLHGRVEGGACFDRRKMYKRCHGDERRWIVSCRTLKNKRLGKGDHLTDTFLRTSRIGLTLKSYVNNLIVYFLFVCEMIIDRSDI